MIEILHKAKRIDTGEWIYGFYVLCRRKGYILPIFNVDDEKYGFDERYQEFIEIDPETVCAYIGKNDDKGNKIWLHDIIEINTYNYTELSRCCFGEVIYCETRACWCIKEPYKEKLIPLCECEGSYKTEITRFGNVFDDIGCWRHNDRGIERIRNFYR